MRNIVLNGLGEILKPLEGLGPVADAPVLTFRSVNEQAKEVGTHAVCGGPIALHRVSPTWHALYCSACGLRVSIPKQIRRWLELEEWSAQKFWYVVPTEAAEEEPRGLPGCGGDNLSDPEPRDEAQLRPHPQRTPLENACVTAVARLNDAGFLRFPEGDHQEPWRIIRDALLATQLPVRVDLSGTKIMLAPPLDPQNASWREGDLVLHNFGVLLFHRVSKPNQWGEFHEAPSQLVAEIKGGEVILRVKLLEPTGAL